MGHVAGIDDMAKRKHYIPAANGNFIVHCLSLSSICTELLCLGCARYLRRPENPKERAVYRKSESEVCVLTVDRRFAFALCFYRADRLVTSNRSNVNAKRQSCVCLRRMYLELSVRL
jgi:hypothetical protein